MRLPFRHTTSHEPVGLDLDAGYLAAVEVSGGRILRAASGAAPEGAIRDGEVVDPDGLGAALREFFRANGFARSVRLGVANQQIVVRELELPPIEDERERDAAVRFQAAEAVAMPLEEAVLDHQVIGSGISPEGSPRMHVMVVAARRAMVERLVAAVRAAGLKPVGVDLSAFALVRLLAPPSLDADSARVICHLGGVTNLAIAAGTTCRFTRALAPAPQGEPAEVAAALAGEVRPSIDFYLMQPGVPPVTSLVLAGPGAGTAGLAEELGAQLGLPVEVAQPFGALQGAVLVPGEDPHRHTVAAGLAVGAAG